ncbi:nitrogen assimilation transcriptional regulator NAC [Bosea sp. 685]|uniref:nitrogen assimilation transcriptional regulator NAC n=1 Tax=Bosea sp. 685 TaxID=3080057 RepID=UPI0028934FD7|nr:nitrogen assimilation transcriptional regulator NAC [Bosea sp. 685]WNJ93573.1 nitrogen assimilation transcriptional regulator NAC [Bosea sp. 685]
MDTRRLKSFLKIVDTGSLTRAAAALNIAQPALSQQLVSLESHFKQKLLIRSQQGVTPTEAGLVLYRHARTILKQLEHAENDVKRAATTLSGAVSVGLAPYSAGSTLALTLLTAAREKHPDILLHINEGFGGPFSELIMTGRLDMAVMHGAGPMRGLSFQPLLVEEFVLVAPLAATLPGNPDEPIALGELVDMPLMLPSRANFVRKAVDAAFAGIRHDPRLVAEIESLGTLRDAVSEGAGATILPWSVANQVVVPGRSAIRQIASPKIEDTVSLCVSDLIPLSEAAVAIRGILFEIATQAVLSGRLSATRAGAAE